MIRTARTSHVRNTGVLAVIAALVASVAVLAAAPPASAEVLVSLSAPDGTVGVSQQLSATVSSPALGAPSGTVTFFVAGTSIDTKQVGGTLGDTVQTSWLPTDAGIVEVQARFVADNGEQAVHTRNVSVAKVDTLSSVTVPSSASTATKVSLSAAVKARQGAYVPTGKVTFYLDGGTSIGTGTLDGSGKASLSYTTPSSGSSLDIYAEYGGDANSGASQSATSTIKISAALSSVVISAPDTASVGTAVPLTAKVTPVAATGSVDFSANGKYLGTSKVKDGIATLTWTPGTAGSVTVTAKYSGSSGVAAGSASKKVQVTQTRKDDAITVDPVGPGAPWSPTATTVFRNGDSVQLKASSTSGLPVKLTVVGPCSLTKGVLHVDGSGSCTLTASTAGSDSVSATSQDYSLRLVAGFQTASLEAPASGRYPRGSRLRLSRTSAETSLNQPITWRVAKGQAVCQIVTKGAYYKVHLVKKGTCRVRATAPGVPNQWRPFNAKRDYTVR